MISMKNSKLQKKASKKSQKKGSKKTMQKSTWVTFVAIVVAVVFFIMPAEYGIDPTGIGKKLGLLDLSDTITLDNQEELSLRMVQGTYPEIPDEFDFYEPEVLGEPFSKTQNQPYKSETIIINLNVAEQVEYKLIMKQGDAALYHWSMVEDGIVYSDFHADPGENAEGYPDQYYIRYRESETNQSSGSIVAPFDGNHGWYWLNIEEKPIQITLKVSGYYEKIEELFRSYQ